MRLTRRSFLAAASAAGLSACMQRREGVKRIAVTMDDFTLSTGLPLSPEERNARILSAFSDHSVQALGFVTGDNVDEAPGPQIVQSWADGGHVLGNHTWTHPFASKVGAEAFTAEIARNQEWLSGYSTAQKVLRFPFLDEGDTVETRDAIRVWLAENGYINLPVTVDSFDWFITGRMEARLRDNPNADVSGYRDYYLEATLKYAEYAHTLARDVGLAGMPHVLLTHHNELNGMFMGDLLAHFKANGWELVSAQSAIDHPALQIQPTPFNRQGTLLRVLEAEAIARAGQEALSARPRPIASDFGEADMISRGL